MHLMLVSSVEVQMRRRLDPDRYYTDYRQAAGLLKHDLVWSHDFDGIRLPLSNLIQTHAAMGHYPLALTEIVLKLIETDNDLTI